MSGKIKTIYIEQAVATREILRQFRKTDFVSEMENVIDAIRAVELRHAFEKNRRPWHNRIFDKYKDDLTAYETILDYVENDLGIKLGRTRKKIKPQEVIKLRQHIMNFKVSAYNL